MRYIVLEIPTPWGAIPIMGYGLMMVLGFLSGIALARWRARKCGENPDHVMNLGLLALVGGIGGARLFYVIGNWSTFTQSGDVLESLLAMVNIRAGGLVYYGGLLAAVGLALIYIRRKRLSTRRVLDILAPSLMLGLAFGRAGCTLNGCCWGGECTVTWAPTIRFPFGSPAFEQQAQILPWKVVGADGSERYYEPRKIGESRQGQEVYAHYRTPNAPKGKFLKVPAEFLVEQAATASATLRSRDDIKSRHDRELAGRFRSLPVHPAQIYGIVNGLLLCGLLTVFFRRRTREGQVFALMLMLKPISRFLLEAIRKDTDPVAFGLTLSQNISLWMFAAGVAMWIIIRHLPPVAQVPLSGSPQIAQISAD